MSTWSDARIPDLRGKRAIVTGATSGIGVWTALQLAAHGAQIVLAARNMKRAANVAGELLTYVPRAHIETAPLDLADLASVRGFAQVEARAGRPLDLLVNNAGVAATPRGRTRDGFETQFGVNHLGHFALTGLLLPRLLGAPAPRVVTVGSGSAQSGRVQLDDLQGDRHYSRMGAYAQSKLAELLFIRELARRTEVAHLPLTAVAAHPGWAATRIASGYGAPALVERLVEEGLRLAVSPARRGALPTLYAATMDVPNGSYWGPGPRGGGPEPAAYPPQVLDPDLQDRLWKVSEELTGVRFDALDPRPPDLQSGAIWKR